MRILGVHHIALHVSDVEKMSTFYREVVGLEEITRHHRADGTLRSVWCRLSLSPAEPAFLALEENEHSSGRTEARTGYSLLALSIDRDEKDELLERLKHFQVPIEHTSRWTVYVRDPEGNKLGFSHYPKDFP